MEKLRNVCFISDGGIGKNIVASAVVRAIKEKYKDKNIIYIGGANDLFYYNPNIKKNFNFGNTLYFFDDYVNDETLFLKTEPYLHYDYINKKRHIVDVWCEQIGVESKGTRGDIYFVPEEYQAAKTFIDSITNNGTKEFVLFQWSGGIVPQSKDLLEFQSSRLKMYRRGLQIEEAQKVVNALNDRGYVVGVVGHENIPHLENSKRIFFPIRNTIALLKYAKTFIGIDSFLQHAAATNQLDKKGIVCWGGTSPIVLGYDFHINLTKSVCNTPFCHRPNSYLFDNTFGCSFGEACMKYTSEEIMETFDKEFGENNYKNSKDLSVYAKQPEVLNGGCKCR